MRVGDLELTGDSNLVLAVSLNSAITEVMSVPSLNIGGINRICKRISIASSKSINASRLLTLLGKRIKVIGIAGKVNGASISEHLDAENIPSDMVPIEDYARKTYEIFDSNLGTATLILDKGPTISKQEQKLFMELIASYLPSCKILILAGSVPPGISSKIYFEILRLASKYRNILVFVDCCNKALYYALDANPFLVRINKVEAEEFYGHQINNLKEAYKAAEAICNAGAQWACISLGKQGAILCTNDKGFYAWHQPVEAVSQIGSGDAMLAGHCVGILDELSPSDNLRYAVACGVANAKGLIPCNVSPEQVKELVQTVAVQKLNR